MVKAVVGEEARLTSAEDRFSHSAIPAEVLIHVMFKNACFDIVSVLSVVFDLMIWCTGGSCDRKA